ncbi:nuclear transport factor 2 family protein [Hyalangium sp.]|uniref:nuclear transport factor 2 family protein n=1 Tax=Hyalangium sp. TaxID=2028555 RepID=UPI002D3E62F8|nr:nuclear transport factor 2 family protein [Hyalangium sp.]HYI00438.1 nuclear transport factor 2 family protein [Hyalangium sp.]
MIESNLRAVKDVYAAYDRGDLGAVLAGFTADIVWANPYPAHVPLAGEFRGHEGIRRFVSAIKASSESLAFEPREFIAQGEQVVVLGLEKVRVKPTGRTYENAWVHVWTLREGKAASIRVFGDTAAVSEAFREGEER